MIDEHTTNLYGGLLALELLVINALGNIAQEKADPIGFLQRVLDAAVAGTSAITLPEGNAPEVERAKAAAVDSLRRMITALQANLQNPHQTSGSSGFRVCASAGCQNGLWIWPAGSRPWKTGGFPQLHRPYCD